MSESGTITAVGAVVGTSYYLAPEQILRPDDIDHRVDLFEWRAMLGPTGEEE